MNEIIKVNDVELSVKEYNGQRVITFNDIDTIHGKPAGSARRRFNDNKKYFIENADFFRIDQPSEIRTFGFERPQGGTPKSVILVTESGYLMIVKSFTDDLAWTVQRQLVSYYFKLKEQQLATATEQAQLNTQNKIEIARLLLETAQLDGVSEQTRNRIASEITEMFASKKIGYKTERHYSATEIGTMFGVSAQKIGRVSTEHGLKTEEYGEWYKDIAANGKEVDTFKYNEKAVKKFREIIE